MLAGFPDGRADEGPAAGPATLAGLRLARERGWTAPPTHPAGSDGTPPGPAEAAAESAYGHGDDIEIERSEAQTRTGKGEDAS